MDQDDPVEPTTEGHEATGSFFLDGLTYAPGSGKTEDVPIPDPTDEFKFVRVLGLGGMGIVYEAEEFRTGRHVALKVVAPELRLSEDALTRFEREAKSSASLSHPNCVFVYGAYRVGESPAIAMELMSGDTLDDRIKQGEQIPVRQALDWAIQMLDGLESAHDSGLVHRDVKPSNVFVGDNEKIKIGDFGLTRSAKGNLALTKTGLFVGSPLYASPEQIRGQDVDQRSDIYSVGATLYALLAGRAPHTSTNIGDLFARIATEEPESLQEVRDDIPVDLEGVITRALSKNADDRFANCDEFRSALQQFTSKTASTPRLLIRWAAYMIDTILFYIVPYIIWEIAWGSFESGEMNIQIGSSHETVLFAGCIFGAYIILAEGSTGTTIGKRLLSLRVVNMDGGRPGFLRTTIRLIVLEITSIIEMLGFPESFWSLLKFAVLFSTMRKRNGMRGLHELASGTRVIELRDTQFHGDHADTLVDIDRKEPAAEARLCGHYEIYSPWQETNLGTLWIGADRRLGRDVWVIEEAEDAQVDVTQLTDSSLHYLDRIQDNGQSFLVFESPGGASLSEYRQLHTSLPWPLARQVLIDLMRTMLDSPSLSDTRRLWIGSKGRLRLLPFRVQGTKSNEPLASNVVRSIFDLESNQGALPEDIPSGTRSEVENLLKGPLNKEQIESALLAFESSDSRPRFVTRTIRVAQLIFTSALPLFIAYLMIELSMLRSPDKDPLAVSRLLLRVGLDAATILLPAVILAAIFRGGLGFQIFGIHVVDQRAHRSSRRDCVVRSLITWGPLCAASVAGYVIFNYFDAWWSTILGWSFFALYVMAGIYSIVKPTQSLADRFMGTHLVR